MYAFVVLDSGDLLLYRYTSPFSSCLAGHYLHQYLPGKRVVTSVFSCCFCHSHTIVLYPTKSTSAMPLSAGAEWALIICIGIPGACGLAYLVWACGRFNQRSSYQQGSPRSRNGSRSTRHKPNLSTSTGRSSVQPVAAQVEDGELADDQPVTNHQPATARQPRQPAPEPPVIHQGQGPPPPPWYVPIRVPNHSPTSSISSPNPGNIREDPDIIRGIRRGDNIYVRARDVRTLTRSATGPLARDGLYASGALPDEPRPRRHHSHHTRVQSRNRTDEPRPRRHRDEVVVTYESDEPRRREHHTEQITRDQPQEAYGRLGRGFVPPGAYPPSSSDDQESYTRQDDGITSPLRTHLENALLNLNQQPSHTTRRTTVHFPAQPDPPPAVHHARRGSRDRHTDRDHHRKRRHSRRERLASLTGEREGEGERRHVRFQPYVEDGSSSGI